MVYSPLRRRRAITLIEMLIAIAISLIVLVAVIRIFDQLNGAMNASKASIEQAGELRNVTQRMQADLDGMTASTLPEDPDREAAETLLVRLHRQALAAAEG